MDEGPDLHLANRSSELHYEELEDRSSTSYGKNPPKAMTERTFMEIGNGEEPNESDVDGDVFMAKSSQIVHSASCPSTSDSHLDVFSNDVYIPSSALCENDSVPILENHKEPSSIVGIQLTVPDCEPLNINLDRQTTLAKFLEIAMHNRKWFPLANITATSCGSLLAVSEDWPNWTLDECGVGEGDEVVVVAAAPPSVHVAVFGPSQFEAFTSGQVELKKTDWNWRRIQARVMEKFMDSQEAPYLSDLTYQIHILDGCLAMLFLEPDSGLSFSASDPPQVCILKDTDILLVSNKNLEWALSSSVSIFERRWLLLLSGIATSDFRPGGMFVALDQRQFVNVSSGQIFTSRETAIASLSNSFQEDLRGFVMLLENGNRVPRWRLPQQVRPQLWCRQGCNVEVRNGRVRGEGYAEFKFSESAWLLPNAAGRLVKNFAKAARKG